MSGHCWKYAAQVNHCCAMHDNCYDLQHGRNTCDNNFCNCLENATGQDACQAARLMCSVVKIHGQQAYLDAASYEDGASVPQSARDSLLTAQYYAEPPDFVRIFPEVNGISKEFQALYERCPQVMLTIKSCSLIANLCIQKEENLDCEHDLRDCVREAAETQNTETCYLATNLVISLLANISFNARRNAAVTPSITDEGQTSNFYYANVSTQIINYGLFPTQNGKVQFITVTLGIAILTVFIFSLTQIESFGHLRVVLTKRNADSGKSGASKSTTRKEET